MSSRCFRSGEKRTDTGDRVNLRHDIRKSRISGDFGHFIATPLQHMKNNTYFNVTFFKSL